MFVIEIYYIMLVFVRIKTNFLEDVLPYDEETCELTGLDFRRKQHTIIRRYMEIVSNIRWYDIYKSMGLNK